MDRTVDRPAPRYVGIAYSELCELTKPTTGKTIVYSQIYKRIGQSKAILITCILFLLPAITIFIFELQLANELTPTGVEQHYIALLLTYFLIPLPPLFWRHLSSCILLLKKFSDLAANRMLNYDYFPGWKTGVLLQGHILCGAALFYWRNALTE